MFFCEKSGGGRVQRSDNRPEGGSANVQRSEGVGGSSRVYVPLEQKEPEPVASKIVNKFELLNVDDEGDNNYDDEEEEVAEE